MTTLSREVEHRTLITESGLSRWEPVWIAGPIRCIGIVFRERGDGLVLWTPGGDVQARRAQVLPLGILLGLLWHCNLRGRG